MKITIPVFIIIQHSSDDEFNPIQLYRHTYGDKENAEYMVEKMTKQCKGIVDFDIIEEKVEVELGREVAEEIMANL